MTWRLNWVFGRSRRDPETHPSVRAAYAAHRAASGEYDRLAAPGAEPGTPEAQAAHEAEYRLYLAHKAHHDAWFAVTKNPNRWAPDNWLDAYPNLAFEMHRDFVQSQSDWEISDERSRTRGRSIKRLIGSGHRLFGPRTPRQSRKEWQATLRWLEAQDNNQPASNPPASRLLDARIDELAAEFPEYSSAELSQAKIDADAAMNADFSRYPPYEGPGWTEPPLHWRGEKPEYEKDHNRACEPEAGA